MTRETVWWETPAARATSRMFAERPRGAGGGADDDVDSLLTVTWKTVLDRVEERRLTKAMIPASSGLAVFHTAGAGLWGGGVPIDLASHTVCYALRHSSTPMVLIHR